MELTVPQPDTETTASCVLECRNVSAYRGGTLVFDGLDLCIRTGVNTVVLGPNGAGKSTLLKLLSREIYPVYDPVSSLLVYGKERWNVEELRSRLGIVSHDLQQQYEPHARGRDVMLSGYYSSIDTYAYQRFSPEDLMHAGELMRRLQIADLADRPFGRMSTGQQRRFLLGRALVHNPGALLLDEPTSGLDLSATFSYLETVRALMRSGTQLVLVTHHLHEIPPEIERVIFLKEGRVMAEGEKERLLTSEMVSALFGCSVEVVSANGFYQAVPGR